MPHTPLRPCRQPGCPGFCKPGQVYCPQHAPELSSDALRGSAAFRGYDRKWQAARKAFLEKNPLCAACMKAGRLTPIRYNKLRKFQNRRIENSPQNKGQGQRHLVE